jgi:hypothetical protein
MPGPFLGRDNVHFAQLETVWGTSPGALVGGDAFKTKTRYPFTRTKARSDRSQDADLNQASVLTTQGGRESAEFSYEGDIIPAGNAAAPTAPDMDQFFEAHFGLKSAATAHSTVAAASTATVVNWAVGTFASGGFADGQMVGITVDATFGIEVRMIASHATDAVTLDRALSGVPTTGGAIIGGITYKLSEAAMKSLHLWNYLDGDNFRHKVSGAVAAQLNVDIDFTGDTPTATLTVSGPAAKVETHATAIPTSATSGQPLLPDKSYAWIAALKTCLTKAGFESNNGLELRSDESCSLFPTGVKRSGNEGRYMVNGTLGLLLTTGVVEGYYDNAAALTAYDILVQLGATAGKIVAWRMKRFIPDAPPPPDVNGEVSLELSGRAYGSVGDDELTLSFL